MRRNGNIFHASKRHSTIINNHTIVNTKIPSDFRYLQENEKKFNLIWQNSRTGFNLNRKLKMSIFFSSSVINDKYLHYYSMDRKLNKNL